MLPVCYVSREYVFMAEHPLLKELEDTVQETQQDLASTGGPGRLESWRVAYLGRRGRVTLLLRQDCL